MKYNYNCINLHIFVVLKNGLPLYRDQEAALINQAYSQIDDLNLQLEQERARTREMENQVAIANEELEATATQLDETGRQLDEANNDVSI